MQRENIPKYTANNFKIPENLLHNFPQKHHTLHRLYLIQSKML